LESCALTGDVLAAYPDAAPFPPNSSTSPVELAIARGCISRNDQKKRLRTNVRKRRSWLGFKPNWKAMASQPD
jgi:hypothetical protein